MPQPPYNPFAWPPDLTQAELHYNCNKAGRDKPDGMICPCCNRKQKQARDWFWRDITEDFKNFGGGIPAYFDLLKYLMLVLIIPCCIKVVYHLYLVNQICPSLADTNNRCAVVFGIYYVCGHQIMYDALNASGRQNQAVALSILQLITYLIMIVSTLGVKVFLHLRFKKTNPNQQLFSHFALVIKNLPLYYQLNDLIIELKSIDSSIQIKQSFYLHRTCKAEKTLKALTDLAFVMKNTELELSLLRGQQSNKAYVVESKFNEMKERYLNLYDAYQKQQLYLESNSKKVILVFNTIQQKENIHSALEINQFTKFFHYCSKLINLRKDNLPFYSERITEPQQIYWKFMGESSTQKMKTGIQTALIGAAFIVMMFVVLYFPMMSIDQVKINNPAIGPVLGALNSLVITILVFVFRYIITIIMPLFRPSSKIVEGQFTVITIGIFFFCFYVVSPVCFYIFDQGLPDNLKLGSFFMTILIFCIFTLGVNVLDLGYRTFMSQKNKVLGNQREANKYCQSRLHEMVSGPSFPVAFKMVVAFNMWSFNSYYIFNLPMLLLVFLIVLFLIYWIDKYLLYKHYKLQSYISLQLLQRSQRVILFLFVLCVSSGYLTITQYTWQKILIALIGLLTMASHLLLQRWLKNRNDKKINYSTDIQTAVDKCLQDSDSANILQIREKEMSTNFIFADHSRKSRITDLKPIQGNASIFGYEQTYKLFLNQFQNPLLQKLIEDQLFLISKVKPQEIEMRQHKSHDGELKTGMLHLSMQRRSFADSRMTRVMLKKERQQEKRGVSTKYIENQEEDKREQEEGQKNGKINGYGSTTK